MMGGIKRGEGQRVVVDVDGAEMIALAGEKAGQGGLGRHMGGGQDQGAAQAGFGRLGMAFIGQEMGQAAPGVRRIRPFVQQQVVDGVGFVGTADQAQGLGHFQPCADMARIGLQQCQAGQQGIARTARQAMTFGHGQQGVGPLGIDLPDLAIGVDSSVEIADATRHRRVAQQCIDDRGGRGDGVHGVRQLHIDGFDVVHGGSQTRRRHLIKRNRRGGGYN